MPADIPMAHHRGPNEPTDGQIQAGNYQKPRLRIAGMEIAIENPVGSVRCGVSRAGKSWQTRMLYPYGYVAGSCGVDGDPVDCYVGPNPDAQTVYVVHQRKAGRWDQYDEDKAMIGFDSESDATHAYLQHYDDPRFLGPVTAMPIAEFAAKVKATKGKPAMIKAIVFIKGLVAAHTRHLASGRVVNVNPYSTRRPRGGSKDGRQLDLFRQPAPAAAPYPKNVAENPERHTVDMFTGETRAEREGKIEHRLERLKARRNGLPEPEAPAGKTRRYYVTMIRDPGPRQRVAWLAGPFDTHDEAKAHVERARQAASKVDPFSDFDAFGTASRIAEHHPPGVLNMHLGIQPKEGEPAMAKSCVLFIKSDAISTSMREKIGRVGSEHREKMPADAFLLGEERKYPVKVKEGGKWVYSPTLLEAAARRARMEGRDDLATRADKIRADLK